MSDDHKHRARIFLHRGDLIQARAAWEAAFADDRASNNQPDFSDSLGNLGNVCALSGDLDRAEACYRKVLAIQRTERNQQAIAHTLVHLGNLHIGAGHPEKARPYYLEALDLLKPLNDDRALGILYHNIGMEEACRTQWDEATAYFTRPLMRIASSAMRKGWPSPIVRWAKRFWMPRRAKGGKMFQQRVRTLYQARKCPRRSRGAVPVS